MHVALEAANSGLADHPVRLGERAQARSPRAGLAAEIGQERERIG
jgi:hypothetical protein